MNFKDVYEKEHVTRKFTNRKLQEKTIAGIVKMAQQSPSLLNSQPWRAYVLMGDALSKFKAASAKKIDDKEAAHEDFASMLSLDWILIQVVIWLRWVHPKVSFSEISFNYLMMRIKQCSMHQQLSF